MNNLLFNGTMIQALLDGRKTQTRRIVKPQPPGIDKVRSLSGSGYNWMPPGPDIDWWRPVGPVWAVRELMEREPRLVCPYGNTGNLLWVRENFAHYSPKIIKYRSDGSCSDGDPREHYIPGKWRPSIHMPRWASRLTLRIKSVRVERVQDISEGDARAEGVGSLAFFNAYDGTYKKGFISLWDSLNAKRGFGWDANPWVWCIEFEVIRQNIDEVKK